MRLIKGFFVRWHWVFVLIALGGTLPAFFLHLSQRPNSFATYYTASDLFWNNPDQFAHAYDNDWFASHIDADTFHNTYDIFMPNPPTAALVALPLLLLSGQAGLF